MSISASAGSTKDMTRTSSLNINDRIRAKDLRGKLISETQAAEMIRSGMTVGCSGFVSVGHPKRVLKAAAAKGRAKGLHLLSGGGTGDECVGELARNHMLAFLCPYNNNPDARRLINAGEIEYVDMHLSDMPGAVRSGLLGNIDLAVIECCMINDDGGIVPTLSVGASEAFVECAEKVILELNLAYPSTMYGLHRMTDGTHSIKCDPKKIAGIVVTDEYGQLASVPSPSPTDDAIAENVIKIIQKECADGRVSGEFAIEPGIGSVAVAVFTKMSSLMKNGSVNYVGVVQDSAIDLLLSGNIKKITGAALRLSENGLSKLLGNIDRLRGKIEILPQDVSNNCGNLDRCRLIAVNTAIEADITGNINSTHLLGDKIMNGIGGAADFARHSVLSVFMTPSVAKNGQISCIVPSVSHVDHNAYDVDFIVTEQGYADLRCKAPYQRAEQIINNCAEVGYREQLKEYLNRCARSGYTPFDIEHSMDWHKNYILSGNMRGSGSPGK